MQDDLNLCILLMFKGTFSQDAACILKTFVIILPSSHFNAHNMYFANEIKIKICEENNYPKVLLIHSTDPHTKVVLGTYFNTCPSIWHNEYHDIPVFWTLSYLWQTASGSKGQEFLSTFTVEIKVTDRPPLAYHNMSTWNKMSEKKKCKWCSRRTS